jgi:adenylate cyclase
MPAAPPACVSMSHDLPQRQRIRRKADPHVRRLLVSLLIALAVALALTVDRWRQWSILNLWELQAGDLVHFKATGRYLGDERVQRLLGAPPVTSRIVIVAIDDRSLERLGAWHTWPRRYYADVLRFLHAAGARAIGVDLLFAEPSPDDAELAAAMAAAGMVVQPVIGKASTDPRRPDRGIVSFPMLLAPQPTIATAGQLGHVNVIPDIDGTVRRVPLVLDIQGRHYPALSLALASLYLRRPQPLDAPPDPLSGWLRAAGRVIPVDEHSHMLVHYAGAPSSREGGPYRLVSFVDVLDGHADPHLFRDKIVLIGLAGATGFADDYWVPTSQGAKMAGVEIHANAVATLLSGAFLKEQGPASLLFTLMALCMTVAGAAATWRIWRAAVLALTLLVAYLYLATGIFFDAVLLHGGTGQLLGVVHPAFGIIGTFAGVVAYRAVMEQATQRAYRRVMAQYLSPQVMQEVLRDPEQLRLGGERREMTVLFSDIRGFTSMAESMEPQALVQFLNEYLTAMTDVILAHGGTIDKYMGDAIMAFWGAPTPQPDHALRACRAALDMQAELSRLRPVWAQAGLPEIHIGVGLSTGPMSVGNMGSRKRFDYTVIGDAVNLGARLESANKLYGSRILLSEATWRALLHLAGLSPAAGTDDRSAILAVCDLHPFELVARFIDLVAVPGRREPVAIYELLGERRSDGGTGHLSGRALRRYMEGIALYRSWRFAQAEEAFVEVLREVPNDGPSAVYLQRCLVLLESPPAPDWDGVYVITQK